MDLEQILEGKIFLIDKPLDWTSFDIVNKIKWKIKKQFNLKKIKVGHAGTLDPKATGLLIVCVGKATKQIQQIQDASKIYSGEIKLGVETPSYDLETEEYNPREYNHLQEENIKDATQYFIGNSISQKPPIYSALKREGKRLYEFARKGIHIDVPIREISIYDFKITKINLPYVEFLVHCSKGTYVRSLAHDFGENLGVGGYLTKLRREKVGEYDVKDSDNSILL